MVSAETEYISVGGNRHPAAADWHRDTGLLAFGADNNVALWMPKVLLLFVHPCALHTSLLIGVNRILPRKEYTRFSLATRIK